MNPVSNAANNTDHQVVQAEPIPLVPLFKCDFCEFVTQYNSNMFRHKRRKNHFSNSQDKTTPKETEMWEIFSKVQYLYQY